MHGETAPGHMLILRTCFDGRRLDRELRSE